MNKNGKELVIFKGRRIGFSSLIEKNLLAADGPTEHILGSGSLHPVKGRLFKFTMNDLVEDSKRSADVEAEVWECSECGAMCSISIWPEKGADAGQSFKRMVCLRDKALADWKRKVDHP